MNLHKHKEDFFDLATITARIRKTYESLHKDLLYTNQQQNFQDAIIAFETIDSVFDSIDE